MPTEFLFILCATLSVVPDPMNGSSTVFPSLVKSLMNHSGKDSGNAALWFLFEHSVANCKTLVGYAFSFPIQFEMFFPNPLPTFELSRILSVSLRF